ncbi:MAG TPA: guanylate kinase [Syntrophomonadaceae bacterium]|nr:guanylate kinase [Syntrophomonadaceae bacterium]
MNRRGKLFIISGPSGVGKGTITRALLPRLADVCLSISATTRAPRPSECNGREYFFVDDKEFDDLIHNQRLLEWARVYSNRYGTPRDFVLDTVAGGEDVLLEIDIQGAQQVKERMPQGVFIFISPPKIEDLAYRLQNRGQDSESSIQTRLEACQREMEHARYYDYIVINDIIEDAVDRVRSIIIAERCRIEKRIER